MEAGNVPRPLVAMQERLYDAADGWIPDSIRMNLLSNLPF